MNNSNKKSPDVDEDITVPPNIEVKPENELEERILREADNDFYDEKSPKNKSKHSSIYRSKALKQLDENKNSVAQDSPRKLSHAEKIGIIISVIMLIYAIATFDKPLVFMALSLLVHFIRPAVGALFGKHNLAAQNALRTFSFVLIFGAILFLFTG